MKCSFKFIILTTLAWHVIEIVQNKIFQQIIEIANSMENLLNEMTFAGTEYECSICEETSPKATKYEQYALKWHNWEEQERKAIWLNDNQFIGYHNIIQFSACNVYLTLKYHLALHV